MKHTRHAQRMPSIYDELRTALVVHRTGSMANAARALGVTPSTVSRQIGRLRELLGFYPFVRTDGNWRLNPALIKLVEAFESAEGTLASELHRLNQRDPDLKREIKIAGPASLLTHVLIPNQRALAAAHPSVVPVFERRVNADGLGPHDVVLAFQPPETGRLKVRRCGTLEYLLYATGSWKPGDGWVTLIDRYASQHYENLKAHFGSEATLKLDSFDQALKAIRELDLAGPLPHVLARNVQGVSPLDGDNYQVQHDVFLIHHESRSNDPDLRSTVDWILDSLAETLNR